MEPSEDLDEVLPIDEMVAKFMQRRVTADCAESVFGEFSSLQTEGAQFLSPFFLFLFTYIAHSADGLAVGHAGLKQHCQRCFLFSSERNREKKNRREQEKQRKSSFSSCCGV